MEVGWAGSAPHIIYIHHAPISDTKVFLFFGLLVFPLHVSRCMLSAFVVLITTYPELSRSSEMLQQSVLQETWNKEHQLPQVFSDPLTKSDEQSRILDEAVVGFGARYSISASTEIVEHSCLVNSADPVQQNPCVPLVQIGQMLDSSTLPETICSEYLSSHSSENSDILSTSSSLSSSSDSPNLKRSVTVEGDQAVFSEIMQITTSAVRKLWIAGEETVYDLACLYATPREICYHLDEHSLEDKHIDSAVRSWTVAKRWVSSWKRYSLRRQKRKVLSPRPVPDNKAFKNDRFGKICAKDLSVFSNSQIPTQATTTAGEPAFHSSSPVILQQLVQVIRKMGQHSRFSVEVSDGSDLTMQLLQRRFQRFSDDWLRRIMNALRKWQIWASKHRPPLPFWNPSANQLGEYLISVDKRGPTVARSVWTQLDWVRRELGGAFPTDSLLLASFKLHAVGHLPTPAAEMPPGVFLAITNLSSTTQDAVAIFGGIVMLLAIACLRWRHQARSIVQHFDEQFPSLILTRPGSKRCMV